MSKPPIHLDADVLRALLAGDLSEELERRLAAHLVAGDCARCNAFLDSLDPAREQELLGLLRRAERAPDLPPGMRDRVLDETAPRRRFVHRWLVPVAGLALLVLVGTAAILFSWHDEDSGPAWRVKGGGSTVAVELGLGLVDDDASGGKRVVRVGPDAAVPRDSTLVFRVVTGGACYLYLVEIGPAGHPQVLLPADPARPLRHEGGRFLPGDRRTPAGVRVEGPAGRRWFAAVCAARPLDPEGDLEALADRLRSGTSQEDDVVSYDVVEIQVMKRGARP